MRFLTCQRCQEVVGVHEIPAEFLDPDTYVCGQCLEPIEGQLEIGGAQRTEERRYDPSQSALPEGY